MAYALNYPNAPAAEAQVAQAPAVETPAIETPAAPLSFFARLHVAIQRSQMARVQREMAIYAPNLYAQMKADGDFSKFGLKDSAKLPFVK